MANRTGKGNWKRGQSGNKMGRPPVILPEVQRAIDANKNAIKVLILQKIEPKIAGWIENIIDTGMEAGDVVKLKILLEMVFGKIPEDPKDFDLTPDEKALVLTYRQKVLEANGSALQSSDHGSNGAPETEGSS